MNARDSPQRAGERASPAEKLCRKPQIVRAAVRRLHRWYRDNARDLPWRRQQPDPYAIWISEVMLQQTQVATVIPYYDRWLECFPDVGALANADEQEVLLIWQGLGYYSRARNLQKAARYLLSHCDGEFPRSAAGLLELPGVGPYTAAALGSIAFGLPLAAVDGNVKRVIARLCALDKPLSDRPALREVEAVALSLLGRNEPGQHNQAMMELGARVCTPRAPHCDICPLAAICSARAAGKMEDYPRKGARRQVPHHHLAAAVVYRGDSILLYKRPYDGMLAGLWDLPHVRVESVANEKCASAGLLSAGGVLPAKIRIPPALRRLVREHYGLDVACQTLAPAIVHAYTHLKVTIQPFLLSCTVLSAPERRRATETMNETAWVSADTVRGYPLARAGQKVLAQAFRKR